MPRKILPISSEADFRASRNLIVGTDFQIDPNKVKPKPPAAPPFPGNAGNLRVENNAFVTGNIYKSLNGEWLSLSELFKQMIPEIKVFNGLKIATSAATADPPNNTVPLDSTLLTSSTLTNPASATVFVSLAGVELQPKTAMSDWWTDLTNPANGAIVSLGVTVGALVKKAGTDNVFEGSLSWSAGPKSLAAPADVKIFVTALILNVIVVFTP